MAFGHRENMLLLQTSDWKEPLVFHGLVVLLTTTPLNSSLEQQNHSSLESSSDLLYFLNDAYLQEYVTCGPK